MVEFVVSDGKEVEIVGEWSGGCVWLRMVGLVGFELVIKGLWVFCFN